jgi:hypothetical protein
MAQDDGATTRRWVDYPDHGTTTIFAASNTATGQVL